MNTTSPITRFLIVLASFVVVVAGMKAAESLLVPFLLSMFIAIISTPPLLWLRKRGLPTWCALLSIVLVIAIGSVLFGAVVGSSLSDFKKDLPMYQTKLTGLTSQLFVKLDELGINIELKHVKESFNPSVALSMAGNTLASFGNLMTNFFLILLTVVFILAEEASFSKKLAANVRTKNTLEAIQKFTAGVNQYVAIKTMMSALTGGIIMLWLWILGLDYFVLWGLMAFLLNFIPTFGSILAAVPAILLAMVQLGLGPSALVAVGFLAVNFGVGNIIEPRIMGRGLNLSPLVVFLSLVFWGWVLGPVGMLLSIPLTMTVKIALESFPETQWVGVMLGGAEQLDEEMNLVITQALDKPEVTEGDSVKE